jgi:small subunit ribosomal protein S28e
MADEIEATPAKVVKIVGRTGVYGEIHQVMAKIMEGRNAGRIIRRNVMGTIKVGDILMLLNTEEEAKSIRAKR